MADVAVNAAELRNFGRALRKVSRDGYKQYRRALKEATVEVVAEARTLASQHSATIPATIKPFAVGATIGVQVGSSKVPIGELFEEGNAGTQRDLLRSATTGKFGHPVFGQGWTTQDMHPAVVPAVISKQEKTVELLLEGVNRAFQDVGLEME